MHANYLKGREKYLHDWLAAVMLRQSLETEEFRAALYTFIAS